VIRFVYDTVVVGRLCWQQCIQGDHVLCRDVWNWCCEIACVM